MTETCRICFESDGGVLIEPCHCKGTQRLVHRECLEKWREMGPMRAETHCSVCQGEFKGLSKAKRPFVESECGKNLCMLLLFGCVYFLVSYVDRDRHQY